MSKIKLYTSTSLHTEVSWDVDKSFAFPVPMQYNNAQSPTIGDNFTRKAAVPPPQRKKSTQPTIDPTPLRKVDDYILIFLSQPYPLNIQFRTDNELIQENIVDFPFIPNVQFVEDILIKGNKIKKIKKEELRRDNNISLLSNFDNLFYDFLNQKTYNSLRNFILASNTFNTESLSKKSYTLESISTNNSFKVSKFLDNFLSQNNILALSTTYKIPLLAGILTPPIEPPPGATQEEINAYEEKLANFVDKFDYDTSIPVNGPSSLHITNYWNPIHLNSTPNNLLSVYTRTQRNDLSSHVFVQFNNIFPSVEGYENPLQIEIISLSSNTITYSYTFPLGRTETYTTTVDNSQICFVGTNGIIRQFMYDGLPKRFFQPRLTKLPTTITKFDEDTKETTFTINGQSYTQNVFNTNLQSVDTSGIIEIDNSYSNLYFYQ